MWFVPVFLCCVQYANYQFYVLCLAIGLLSESAKEDIKTFEDAEKELMEIEKDLQSSEAVSLNFLLFG